MSTTIVSAFGTFTESELVYFKERFARNERT